MTTLYLLAHQDDEIGVLHDVASRVRAGTRVLIVYLTNGAWAGVTSQRRNGESLSVLATLGVPRQQVLFSGEAGGVGDGQLIEHSGEMLDHVLSLASDHGPIARIITHAWEQGHHDHDAAHLIGQAAAAHLGVVGASRQFPLYRPRPDGRMIFDAPIADHGALECSRISWSDRVHYLGLLPRYRSQLRVMVQLGTRLAWSYLSDGHQKLQSFPEREVLERPITVTPLYETWGLYTRDLFERHARAFIATHLTSVASPPHAAGASR